MSRVNKFEGYIFQLSNSRIYIAQQLENTCSQYPECRIYIMLQVETYNPPILSTEYIFSWQLRIGAHSAQSVEYILSHK